jgi:hypothetical protein
MSSRTTVDAAAVRSPRPVAPPVQNPYVSEPPAFQGADLATTQDPGSDRRSKILMTSGSSTWTPPAHREPQSGLRISIRWSATPAAPLLDPNAWLTWSWSPRCCSGQQTTKTLDQATKPAYGQQHPHEHLRQHTGTRQAAAARPETSPDTQKPPGEQQPHTTPQQHNHGRTPIGMSDPNVKMVPTET